MKKSTLFTAFIMFLALCIFCTGCAKTAPSADLWADAMYTENTELGNGEKTISVEVVTPEKTVVFTLHTDKSILGEALVEHNLIEGEKGAYGLYVKKVNGILADYDINGCYWGFNKNGEGMMTGVDGAEISDGDRYSIVYTKQ